MLASPARFTVVLAVVVLLIGAAPAAAEVLQAELAFTVPTEGTPWSLSYSEANNEWAVFYRDTQTIRYYSTTGELLRTYAPTLTLTPTMQSQWTSPALCDFSYDVRDGSPGGIGLLGDPNAAHLPEGQPSGDVYSMQIQLVGVDPGTGDVDFSHVASYTVVDGTFQLARIEYYYAEDGSLHSGVEVGLDVTGTKLFLCEEIMQPTEPGWDMVASVVIDLADWGIDQAQSVTFRQSDLSPVVLHDNEITIFKRPLDDTSLGLYPDYEVGDLIEHWTIEGLPEGAVLIDLDQVRPILSSQADAGVFYVLDQTTGGVYRLVVPEPASLGLLVVGLAGLAARRRKR